jgi:hypothetical protein
MAITPKRVVLRFADLKKRGVVSGWTKLRSLIEHEEFPPGFYLAANSRAWFEHDINEWLDTRTAANSGDYCPALRGAAKQNAISARARRLHHRRRRSLGGLCGSAIGRVLKR